MSPAAAKVEPSDAGYLDTGDGQLVYWEIIGPQDGKPALFLHGGPGTGCSDAHRMLFKNGRFRAVLFDQRGCGRSRPLADTSNADLTCNTTQNLIGDIERLRQMLAVEQWTVVGGSWGVTLGLAYAQQLPERVDSMVLAAVTSGARHETDWITKHMRRVFPREWEEFAALVAPFEREGDLAAAYARLLARDDPSAVLNAARSWCRWEDTHISLGPGAEPYLQHQSDTFQQVVARLVTHYWSHGSFLDAAPINDHINSIAHIPAALIHGRFDISGPLDVAWDLHASWPASRLVVLDAGHSGEQIYQAITRALEVCPDFDRMVGRP